MRRRFQYSTLLLIAVLTLAGAQVAAGGSGFFRLSSGPAPARFIAPGGQPMPLLAAAHLRLITASAPRTDLAPAYVDERAAAIISGLRALGFNALGPDSDADTWHRGLPFIQSLDISQHLQANQQTPLFDVYASGFTAQVQALAQAACAPEAGDAQLIGYLSDAGLSWDPAQHAALVLTYFLQLPPGAPGRQRAEDYVRVHYNSDIRRLNQAWGEQAKDFIALTVPAPGQAGGAGLAAFTADAVPFAQQVLVRYLQVVANAVHSADPNHLFLGAGLYPGDPELAWSIPDMDAVRLSPTQDPGPVIAALPRPALAMEEGCGPASAATRAMLSLTRLTGYIWVPSGDWQSGACAAQARTVWNAVNRAAIGPATGP